MDAPAAAPKLDPTDLALLAALQRDAAATHQALGDALHLSASQISRRIQRLQAEGIIAGLVARLDATRLGLRVRAFTEVTLARHGDDTGRGFERGVAAIPQVLDCWAITGQADYMLQIVAADLDDLSTAVLKRLTRLPGVTSIRSSIALERIKATTELPLDHLGPARPARR